MTLSWPNHLLTLDEWEALPELTEAAPLEVAGHPVTLDLPALTRR